MQSGMTVRVDEKQYTKQMRDRLHRITSNIQANQIAYTELYMGTQYDTMLAQFAYQLFDQMDEQLPLQPATIQRKTKGGQLSPHDVYYESGDLKRNMYFTYSKPQGKIKGTLEVKFRNPNQRSTRTSLRHEDIFNILESGQRTSTGVYIPPRPVMYQQIEQIGLESDVYQNFDTGRFLNFQDAPRGFAKQSQITQSLVGSAHNISLTTDMDIDVVGWMEEQGLNEWEFVMQER